MTAFIHTKHKATRWFIFIGTAGRSASTVMKERSVGWPGLSVRAHPAENYKTQFSNYILLRDVLQRKARIPASPIALGNNQDSSESKKDLAVVEFCKCCGMFGTSQLRSNQIENVQLKMRTKHWDWKLEILYEVAETWCHNPLSQTSSSWG